jgi:hypothetical protein
MIHDTSTFPTNSLTSILYLDHCSLLAPHRAGETLDGSIRWLRIRG